MTFDNSNKHTGRIQELVNNKNFSSAREELLSQLKVDDKDSSLYNNLAVVEYLDGKTNEAVELLAKALELSPEFITAHENLYQALTNGLEIDDPGNLSEKANILIVFHHPSRKMRATVSEHLYSFEKYSGHNVFYSNTYYNDTISEEINSVEFDLIIFHTIFFSHRWEIEEFTEFIRSDKLKQLKESSAVKIAIPQDEWIYTDALCEFINIFGVTHVFSVSPESEWEKIYSKVESDKVKYHKVLTGYLDPGRLEKIKKLSNEKLPYTIDIGYRARGGRKWLGKHGYMKGEIAEVFKNATLGTEISTNISIDEIDVLLGDEWFRFMMACRYFIGIEGGSSIHDPKGEIKNAVEEYERKHPNAGFEQVRDACYQGQDGNLNFFALSPRQLEACATRTCQILIEGEYDGVLKPGLHYIELKKDYSNLKQVIQSLTNEKKRKAIVDRAYKDIVESGKYGYDVFANSVIDIALSDRSVPKDRGIQLNSEYLNFLKEAAVKLNNEGHEERSAKLIPLVELLQNFLENKYNLEYKKHLVSADYLAARPVLGQLTKMLPDNPKYLSLFASVLLKLGESTEALPILLKIKDEYPDFMSNYFILAQVYFDERKYYVAESYTKQFLEPHPANIEALNLLGSVYMATGRYSDADSVYNKVLKLNPDNINALAKLAKIELLSSNYERAFELIQRAIKLDPEDQSGWNELITYAQQTNNNEILKAGLTALHKIDPANVNPDEIILPKDPDEKIVLNDGGVQEVSNTVLLIYHHPFTNNAANIIEHINSFQNYSKFNIIKVNTALGFPSKIKGLQFPVVVLHYSLFGTYPYPMADEFRTYIAENKNSYKIAFFQDEYYYCRQRFDFLNRYKIDSVFTLLEKDSFKLVYEKYSDVSDITHNLTGYVSDNLVELGNKLTKPFSKRHIDIGYRARQLPYYMGKGAQEKHLIAELFKKHVNDMNLKLDIETKENKRIYGGSWFGFMSECSAMLGVEAGVSVYDLNGEVRMKIDRFLEDQPSATFDEAHEAILNPYEDLVPYRMLSPRHFESAALRVAQILFEGNYSGVLKPMEHYIPLKKDFSNIKEVLELFRDVEFREEITDRAYNGLIASGEYSYRNFMVRFDEHLISKGFIPDLQRNYKFEKGFAVELEPKQYRGQNSSDIGRAFQDFQENINKRLMKISDMDHEQAETIKHLIVKYVIPILHKFKDESQSQLFLSFLDERVELLNFDKYVRKNWVPFASPYRSMTEHSDLEETASISVCIFTYNRSEFLAESIKSLLSQNYQNYEVVVVDDGSTEDNDSVIKSLGSDKVKYFRNNENKGRPFARNMCIEKAGGDYILWLGDDDLLSENTMRNYARIVAEKPDVDVIYSNIQVFDSDTGQKLELISAEDYTESNETVLENMILGSGITDTGSFIKKSLYEKVGNYSPEYLRAQDNEFWSRIALQVKFHKYDNVACLYRKHNSNASFGDFIDRSYESKTIRTVLSNYPLEKVFPSLNWNLSGTRDAALFISARSLFAFNDYYNAAKILENTDYKTNNEAVILLFNCYVGLSLLDEAEKLLNEVVKGNLLQQEQTLELANKLKDCVEFNINVNKLIEANELAAVNELIENHVNKIGYNHYAFSILGVLLNELGDKENAYRYLKLAVTFNPANNDSYKTTINLAGEFGKEEEIENMRNRLIEDIPLNKAKSTSIKSVRGKLPLVSVIIPTYNRLDKVGEAVESALNQSYTNIEVIVVNDEGEDVTPVLSIFNDDRLKLITHEKNKGLAGSRNTGIRNAEGKYIALLDDDDKFYRNHLEVAVSHLLGGERVVYTDAERHSYKSYGDEYVFTGKSVPYSIDYDRNKLLIGNIAPVNCFVFEKKLAESAGLFDEKLPVLEDWEFWLRLSDRAGFKHIKQSTVVVNWFDDGSTMTSSKQEDFSKTRNLIYSRYRSEIDKISNPDEIVSEFNAIWANDFTPQNSPVSIIALSFNQIEYTENFVESVFKYTKIPFELILIDNASSEETVGRIRQLEKSHKELKVIYNNENCGFPAGINQAIMSASGNYILVANNDILVTEGWLERMLEVAESSNAIGIVGPISNSVSGFQLDKEAKYDSIESMYEYAANVTEKNKGQVEEFPRIAFLCTLIKREVINKIGGLDERFAPGNFEDDDFCLRAQLAGYKTVIAQDVFIHHFGSVSFKAEGNDEYLKRLDTNKQKFVDKWGADPEEIWLKGKEFKKHSLTYSVHQDEFRRNLERAFSELESKDYEYTLRYLENTISVFDENNSQISYPELLNLLGNTALICNDLEKANSYFEEELKATPESSRACLGMAQVFNAAEMYREAKSMLEYACVYDNTNEASLELLKQVNEQLQHEPDHNSLLAENKA